MKYDPKHLRSIQALPDTRRITIFLSRDEYFLEGMLNACEIFINSIALEIDQRVKPKAELVVGVNFFNELRASSSSYFEEYAPTQTNGPLAIFNSWNIWDGADSQSQSLPIVGPDGAYFLVLATASNPSHKVLLGSIAFILRGKQ